MKTKKMTFKLENNMGSRVGLGSFFTVRANLCQVGPVRYQNETGHAGPSRGRGRASDYDGAAFCRNTGGVSLVR